MKKLRCLILKIDEELESAKDYAETYIEMLASGNLDSASKYKKMAEDELRHSEILFDEAVALYDKYKMIARDDDLEIIKKENRLYIERSNHIKLMLNN